MTGKKYFSGKVTVYVILIAVLLAVFFADLLIGSVKIPFSDIVNLLSGGQSSSGEYDIILFSIRIPRALTALFAGMALSVSGLQMQTVFRNPLAGPYVLGISAGASLGVAVVVLGFSGMFAGFSINALGSWGIAVSAWIGAGMVLFLILLVSVRVRDIMTILILGILFGSATTAFVSILQYFSSESMLKSFVIWTLGSLGGVSVSHLSVLIPSVFAGLLLAILSSKQLNALLLGENYARSLGMNIPLSRFLIFLSTAILSGTVTAFCGPIGFIGIAVPHISKLLIKNADHRQLTPATMLLGGIFLIISDIISQLPGYDSTLPINSVTALLGIPVVIWIVIRNQRISTVL
jgi:iron complex transport system permease protein